MAGTSLWRNSNYRTFLGIQTLSAIGDSFSYVAIPLLVLQVTGSLVQMGIVTGLTGVASITTGVFAGVVVDRFDRRTLLMICDGARCVLYGTVALVFLVAEPSWLIYLVVPLAGVFSMIFQVTYVAVVPAIVPTDQITRANGHLYATYAIASVAGPALAGLVAAAFGAAAAIGVDAITFAVAAIGVLFIRLAARPAQPGPADAEAGGVRNEFLAGARFVWAHPLLRQLTLLLSLLTFLTYGLTDTVIFRLKDELGQSDAVVGYVLTAGTVGTFVASSVVARVRGRLGFGPSWISAFSLAGLAVAGMGLVHHVPALAVFMAVMLLGSGVAGICSMSLRQEITPSHLLGRVTAAFWTIHSALGPLGAATITALAAGFGVTPVLVVVGTAMVLIALSGAFSSIGRAGVTPAAEPALEGARS
ncbi:MFS transporter [Micromonospora wenchangensis]|uniref:MFS transporter n=1 Tax=Micromonospora wenchangensis TaxID=1185415 RepID=A0A2D0AXS5_9ACTN|nr:MFS transporter [Micromonospora wenchangensis]OWV11566.1 MFS transporter [Micromonospora wenchangensis]